MATRIQLGLAIGAAALLLVWFGARGIGAGRASVARAGLEPMAPAAEDGPLAAPAESDVGAAEPAPAPASVEAPHARRPQPAPAERAAAAQPAPTPAPEEPEPEIAPTASITGLLESESGRFEVPFVELRGALHLDLVRVSDRETAFAAPVLEPVEAPDGALREVRFRFEGLEPGEYEVTLSTLDHVRWEPGAQRVQAPSAGLRFMAFDGDKTHPLEVEVVDADTGERLPGEAWSAYEIRATESNDSGVLLHAGPLNASRLALSGELDLAVVADGYAAAFTDERAFQFDGATGTLRARVELSRGFACRLVVLGKERGRVIAPGARVEIDGRYVGRTDDGGALLVRAAEAPQSIAVSWRGQRLEGAFGEVLVSRRPSLEIALLE